VAVLVDESVACGVSSDRLAGPVRDDVAQVGCALSEAAVGSVGVVVLDVLAEESLEVRAVPDECAVEELAANSPDPSFGVAVRDRCVWRCADDRRAFAAEHVVEPVEELAGTVTDHEPDCALVVHREVPRGLGCPGAGRIAYYAGEMRAASVEFDEEQDVIAAQHGRVHGEEVTGEDPGCLGAQEACP